MKGKKFIERVYYKSHTQTFNASSNFQSFTVPATTTKLIVDCVASRGANNGSIAGGSGGRVQCTLEVIPNSTLYFYVGDIPNNYITQTYNASDIRTDNTGVIDNTSLSSRLIVAGGGGSANNSSGAEGGIGGGLEAPPANTSSGAAGGGTQTAGGTGGSNGGNDGTFGLGGSAPQNHAVYGACGGAGWYGGGSGAPRAIVKTSAGAGGSSYTSSYFCYDVIHTQGYNDGTGYITITYGTISMQEDSDYFIDRIRVKAIGDGESDDTVFYAVKDYVKGQFFG